MKANGDKYHFLLSTKEKVKANISMNNDKEKLLRGTIDNHLIFESQIKNLCCKPVKNYMPSLGFLIYEP